LFDGGHGAELPFNSGVAWRLGKIWGGKGKWFGISGRKLKIVVNGVEDDGCSGRCARQHPPCYARGGTGGAADEVSRFAPSEAHAVR
jgi:hypothetical protein